ncbi:MAG: hypothetical protein R3B45_12995 [Bdellovibrionota bacterium]
MISIRVRIVLCVGYILLTSCKSPGKNAAVKESLAHIFTEERNMIEEVWQQVIGYYASKLKENENVKAPILDTNFQLYRSLLPKIDQAYQKAQQFIVKKDQNINLRAGTAIGYIENVLLPFRRLHIALTVSQKNQILDQRLESLMLHFNKEEIGVFRNTIREKSIIGKFKIGIEIDSDGISRFEYLPNLLRDATYLGSIPHLDLYIRALKMMNIHLAIHPLEIMTKIKGKKSIYPLPNSCKGNIDGLLPNKLIFEENGTGFLDEMISRNGLLNDSPLHREYLIDFFDAAPNQGGFSGLLPFENYFTALDALDSFNQKDHNGYDVLPNDYMNFEAMYKLSFIKSLAVLSDTESGVASRYVKENKDDITTVVAKRLGVFSSITEIGRSSAVEVNGERIDIDPQSYTDILLMRIAETKSWHWKDWLSQSQLLELQNNSFVMNKFPINDSSIAWRKWATGRLRDALVDLRDNADARTQYSFVGQFCLIDENLMRLKFCSDSNGTRLRDSQLIQKLIEILGDYAMSARFLPRQSSNWKQIEGIISYLQILWEKLVDSGRLKDIQFTEFEYLESEYDAGNKWAILRISYLAAESIIERLPLHIRRPVIAALSYYEIDKPFLPGIAARVLSKSEQKLFWETIVDEANIYNAGLLKSEKKAQQNRRSYYQLLREIAFQPIWSKKQLTDSLSILGVTLDEQARKEVAEAFASEIGRKAQLLYKLYENRHSLKVQEEIFQEYSNDFDLSSEFSAKIAFLDAERVIKLPLYRWVFRQAASRQVARQLQVLESICLTNDHDDFQYYKLHYYGGLEARRKLAEGGQSAAFALQSQIENIVKADKLADKNFYYSISSAALFVGSLVVSSACTMAAGPLCLPLWQLTATGLGAASLTLGVGAAKISYDRKIAFNEVEERIKPFLETGQTSVSEVDELNVGWGMVAFDTVMLLPMMRPILKTVPSGAVSLKSILRKNGSLSRRKIAELMRGYDVNSAKYILGIVAKNEFDATVDVLKHGKIEQLTQISKRQADDAFVKKVLEVLDSNPEKFHKVMSLASNTKLARLKRLEGVLTEGKAVKVIRSLTGGKVDYLIEKSLRKIVKRRDRFTQMYNSLNEVVDSRSLEIYIKKHLEELGDLFTVMPLLWRDLPYYMLVEGSPMMKISNNLYTRIYTSLTLKRLAIARENLIYEASAAQFARALGLPATIAIQDSYESMMAFRVAVLAEANRTAAKETSLRLLKSLSEFEQRTVSLLKSKNGYEHISVDELKRILFNPIESEIDVGRKLWNSLPSEEVLEIKGNLEFTSEILNELKNYNSVGTFQFYLDALRFRSIILSPKSVIM